MKALIIHYCELLYLVQTSLNWVIIFVLAFGTIATHNGVYMIICACLQHSVYLLYLYGLFMCIFTHEKCFHDLTSNVYIYYTLGVFVNFCINQWLGAAVLKGWVLVGFLCRVSKFCYLSWQPYAQPSPIKSTLLHSTFLFPTPWPLLLCEGNTVFQIPYVARCCIPSVAP